MTVPIDTYIVTVPLYLLAGLWSWAAKPSPVLATRLKRLLTFTLSRPSDRRNILPQILYLFTFSAGQWHSVYSVLFIISTQPAFLPLCVSKFIQMWRVLQQS
jgi:hypothetical protein